MKKRTSKLLVGSLMGIAAVSLVGVGFAAWVINGTPSQMTDPSVQVTFGNVTTNTLKAEYDSTSDVTLCFDSNGGTGNSSLSCSEDLEDRKIIIKYTISSEGSSVANLLSSIKYEFDTSNFNTLTSANYIDLSNLETETIESTFENTTVHVFDKTNANSWKVTSTYEVGWGSIFNNVNPCDSTVTDIGTKLNNFKSAYSDITDKTIKLKITIA